MNTIQNLNIGNYIITIDSDAVGSIQSYLNTLKGHYSQIESGQEIYQDIETRIGEIFQSKLKKGQASIHVEDCDEVILKIGSLADLGIADPDAASSFTATEGQSHTQYTHSSHKLTRNMQDKILTGLGSGIAHYLKIDPVWVRIALILLFSTGIGFIAYLIISLFVPKSYESIYQSKRLMRNNHDKIIGGVCSGFSHYLHIQPWNIRLIFISPLVFAIIGGPFGLGEAIAGLMGTSILSYIVLLITMPKAKSSIDKLQMSGTPVNAKNIQSQIQGTPYAYSGGGDIMRTIVKGIFYFFLGIILLTICSVCFSLLIAGFATLPFADYLLKPGSQSFLGYSAWFLLLATPILWVCAVLYYKLTQSGKTPSWVHKGGLIFVLLGLINAALFSKDIINDFKFKSVKNLSDTNLLLPATDSLLIKVNEDAFIQDNDFVSLYNDSAQIKIHRLQVVPSIDQNYHYRIVAQSHGSSPLIADQYCKDLNYTVSSVKNTMTIPSGVTLKKGQVWRGQSALLIISVPEGKYISLDENSLVQIPRITQRIASIHIDDDNLLDEKDWYQMVNGKLINKTNQAMEAIEEAEEEIENASEELKTLRNEKLDELNEAKNKLSDEISDINSEVDSLLDIQKFKSAVDSLNNAIQGIQKEIEADKENTSKGLKRKIEEAIQKKKVLQGMDTI